MYRIAQFKSLVTSRPTTTGWQTSVRDQNARTRTRARVKNQKLESTTKTKSAIFGLESNIMVSWLITWCRLGQLPSSEGGSSTWWKRFLHWAADFSLIPRPVLSVMSCTCIYFLRRRFWYVLPSHDILHTMTSLSKLSPWLYCVW